LDDINIDLDTGYDVIVRSVAVLVFAHQELDVVNQVETIKDHSQTAVDCLKDLATSCTEDPEY
jgi:hypothetical protein